MAEAGRLLWSWILALAVVMVMFIPYLLMLLVESGMYKMTWSLFQKLVIMTVSHPVVGEARFKWT